MTWVFEEMIQSQGSIKELCGKLLTLDMDELTGRKAGGPFELPPSMSWPRSGTGLVAAAFGCHRLFSTIDRSASAAVRPPSDRHLGSRRSNTDRRATQGHWGSAGGIPVMLALCRRIAAHVHPSCLVFNHLHPGTLPMTDYKPCQTDSRRGRQRRNIRRSRSLLAQPDSRPVCRQDCLRKKVDSEECRWHVRRQRVQPHQGPGRPCTVRQ